MVTTSTAPTVQDTIVTLWTEGLTDAKVFPSWPGPEAAELMVVMGEITWDDYEIATIKAGRKHRQENYSIGFEVYRLGAKDTSPSEPTAARDEAFTLLAAVEDLLAEDPTLGLPVGTVQQIQVHPISAEPRVFEKGWAYRIAGTVGVRARLQ